MKDVSLSLLAVHPWGKEDSFSFKITNEPRVHSIPNKQNQQPIIIYALGQTYAC